MATVQAPTTKTWKSSLNAPAGVQITESTAALVGDKDHFIAANNKGTIVNGNFSVVATAESRRYAGLWVHTNDFTRMIPSTIASPQPMQIPVPPIYFLTDIANTMAHFASFLGGF